MNKEYEHMNTIEAENQAEVSTPTIELEAPKQTKEGGGKLFISNFLNWGNILQSFIGTSILSLPYYCYRVI